MWSSYTYIPYFLEKTLQVLLFQRYRNAVSIRVRRLFEGAFNSVSMYYFQTLGSSRCNNRSIVGFFVCSSWSLCVQIYLVARHRREAAIAMNIFICGSYSRAATIFANS